VAADLLGIRAVRVERELARPAVVTLDAFVLDGRIARAAVKVQRAASRKGAVLRREIRIAGQHVELLIAGWYATPPPQLLRDLLRHRQVFLAPLRRQALAKADALHLGD